MRFIDLFAGIGGFRAGLEKVGGFDCAYSNEYDKYASQVYKQHYGECDTRDIRDVPAGEIPDHDLLCAGFPCQSFSVAGKRKGFEDTRGTLFFEIARIVADKRPRYLLLENVKGLLNHDKGKTFQTILGVLADLGYRVEWQVLNSKHFGVPQNRERVFIVGHLGGGCGRKVFPIRGNSTKDSVPTIRSTYYKGYQTTGPMLKEITNGKSQGMRVYNSEGVSTTIASQAGGMGAKTGLYAVSPVAIGTRIRRLTPTECARLQGFSDDWCDGLSDTQQYKCYGNAVTTNVITAIAARIEGINRPI